MITLSLYYLMNLNNSTGWPLKLTTPPIFQPYPFALQATDADSDDLLSYSLKEVTPEMAADWFVVHPQTGVIRTANTFYTHFAQQFSLKLQVSDGYHTSFTLVKVSSQNLRIFPLFLDKIEHVGAISRLKNSKRTSKCQSILFYSTRKIFLKKSHNAEKTESGTL